MCKEEKESIEERAADPRLHPPRGLLKGLSPRYWGCIMELAIYHQAVLTFFVLFLCLAVFFETFFPPIQVCIIIIIIIK